MMQIVAVVDASADSVIVWHVDLGAGTSGMSRMCGAWVLINEPIKLELLTRDRLVVATAAGAGAMAAAGNHTAMVDLVDTLNNVTQERDRLQRLYDDLPASRKKNLVAPRWPHLPIASDRDHSPRAETTNPAVAVALGVARLLEQLAVAWTAIERQRTARTYLYGDTPGRPPTVRELPLARQ